MNKKILVGADPELFIKKGNEIISAETFIEGTKENPFDIGKGCAIQLDNVACEFNIPPASSFEEFEKSINFPLDFIIDKLKREGLSICTDKSSHSFDKKYLRTENAKKFGCDPDFDVYRATTNLSPSSVGNFRTVAGHIHVGFGEIAEVSIENAEKVVKAFDLFVTVPSILTDLDRERRKLYGKAGSFRYKPEYGVEIRTLSNFWIFDKDYMKKVYDGTILATELALRRDLEEILLENEEDIKKAINSYDEDIAKELIADVITPFYEEKEQLASIKKII